LRRVAWHAQVEEIAMVGTSLARTALIAADSKSVTTEDGSDFKAACTWLEQTIVVGGRIFGFAVDLAHGLYDSLLLPHKP